MQSEGHRRRQWSHARLRNMSMLELSSCNKLEEKRWISRWSSLLSTGDEDQNPIHEQNNRYPNTAEDIRVPKVHQNVQHFSKEDHLEQRKVSNDRHTRHSRITTPSRISTVATMARKQRGHECFHRRSRSNCARSNGGTDMFLETTFDLFCSHSERFHQIHHWHRDEKHVLRGERGERIERVRVLFHSFHYSDTCRCLLHSSWKHEGIFW